MSSHIHIKHGSAVLSEGTHKAPLTINDLDAKTYAYSVTRQLTIYTEAGYKIKAPAMLYLSGTHSGQWQISSDETNWQYNELQFNSDITPTGTTFYVRARAFSDDTAGNDDSVSLELKNVTLTGV